MHKLEAGVLGPDKIVWKERTIIYSAKADTLQEDSIVYTVKALDRTQKRELFSLIQVELKDD